MKTQVDDQDHEIINLPFEKTRLECLLEFRLWQGAKLEDFFLLVPGEGTDDLAFVTINLVLPLYNEKSSILYQTFDRLNEKIPVKFPVFFSNKVAKPALCNARYTGKTKSDRDSIAATIRNAEERTRKAEDSN